MCKVGRSKNTSKKASAKQSSGNGIIPSVNVFFDTETNGLPKENSSIQPAIMQIVIFNQNGESIFSEYVIPYDGKVDGTFIHGISQETLDRNKQRLQQYVNNLTLFPLNDKHPVTKAKSGILNDTPKENQKVNSNADGFFLQKSGSRIK